MGSALKFLTRYAEEGDEFLYSSVIGDETWVSHHTPDSKQQSTAMAPYARRNHDVVQRAGGRLL
jgi:hypothetical protein